MNIPYWAIILVYVMLGIIAFCIFLISLFLVGYNMKFNYLYYIALIIPLTHLLIFQSLKLKTESGNDCLAKFKSNNLLGLIILIILLVGKLT